MAEKPYIYDEVMNRKVEGKSNLQPPTLEEINKSFYVKNNYVRFNLPINWIPLYVRGNYVENNIQSKQSFTTGSNSEGNFVLLHDSKLIRSVNQYSTYRSFVSNLQSLDESNYIILTDILLVPFEGTFEY